MVDEQKLRELAMAATQGEWLKEGHTIYSLMHFGWHKGVEQFKNRFWAAVYKDNACPEEERQANADFIAAANPAAILSMLDELQALRVTAENTETLVADLRKQNEAQKDEWLSWAAKRDGLENDATRYQWLCSFSSVSMPELTWGRRAGIPKNKLDAAIDAAMKVES